MKKPTDKKAAREQKKIARAQRRVLKNTKRIDQYEVEFHELHDEKVTPQVTEEAIVLTSETTEFVSEPKKPKRRKIKKVKPGKTQKTLQKAAQKDLMKSESLKKTKKKEPNKSRRKAKELPVKMVKEVSKIHWSGQKNLWVKFLQVVLFILIFAALFYLIDLGFQALFSVMHVI